MFGGQNHVGRTEQRVGAGCEDPNVRDLAVVSAAVGTRKSTWAPSDRPIQLRCIVLIAVGPVEQVEVGEESVGVCGDAHHPLFERAPEDRDGCRGR